MYTLKTWDRVFRIARSDLFGRMYERSPDWPRVFWKTYEQDGVDPSWSLTHLINDSLLGRMQTSAFDGEFLGAIDAEVPGEDLRALIGEASVRPSRTLPEDEIGCGDMFRMGKGKFLLNLRPDCDCVPRNGQEAGDVELYCIEGRKMSDTELHKTFTMGHFSERIWETVAFSVHEGRSVRFDFRKLSMNEFSCLKGKRTGRLLHPYLTRIQQRFGLYLQRQGLPRIPDEAVSMPGTARRDEHEP